MVSEDGHSGRFSHIIQVFFNYLAFHKQQSTLARRIKEIELCDIIISIISFLALKSKVIVLMLLAEDSNFSKWSVNKRLISLVHNPYLISFRPSVSRKSKTTPKVLKSDRSASAAGKKKRLAKVNVSHFMCIYLFMVQINLDTRIYSSNNSDGEYSSLKCVSSSNTLHQFKCKLWAIFNRCSVIKVKSKKL